MRDLEGVIRHGSSRTYPVETLMQTTLRIIITGLVALASASAVAHVISLEDRLSGVARYYGDANGNIPVVLGATNETKYLAYDDGTAMSIYDPGDTVSDRSTLAACAIDVTGAPTACDADYGEALLVGLEVLQSEEPDPSEMSVSCQGDMGHGKKCVITWDSGRRTCVYCIDTCLVHQGCQ